MSDVIRSDIGIASSYTGKIGGAASTFGHSKHVTISEETNLSGNTQCKTCVMTKKSMVSTYAEAVKKDAAKITKIAEGFETADRTLSKQIREK